MARCDLSIELEQEGRRVPPGTAIRGHVEVFTDGGIQCDALKLAWGWEADGKWVSTRETLDEMVLFSEGELPGPGARRFPFEVEVPEDGPFSYQGRYFDVTWALRAEAEIPWSFDPDAEEEIEVVLPPAPSAEAIGEESSGEISFDDFQEPPDEVPGPALPVLGGIVGTLLLVGGAVAAVAGIVEAELAIAGPGVVCVLAGLLALFGVVRPALAGRRLGPTRVTVTPERVRPGESFVARVEMVPPKELRIRGITATLRAVERVRKRERKFSSSDSSSTRRKRRFHTIHEEVVELAGPGSLPGGRPFRAGARLPVPPDSPPNFFSGYNDILWRVDVRVRIPWWSDLEQEFEIRVGV